MDQKKYTAKEAAYAVLKTCVEVLKKSEEKEPGKKLAADEPNDTPKDGVKGNNPDKAPKEGNGEQDLGEKTLGEKVNEVVEQHLAEHGHEKAEEGDGEKESNLKGHMKLAKFMGRMEHKREGKAPEDKPAQEIKEKKPEGEKPEGDLSKGEKQKKAEIAGKKAAPKKGSFIPQSISSGKEFDNHLSQKGVHMPWSSRKASEGSHEYKAELKAKGQHDPQPKRDAHKEKLAELKSMPKPKLTKKESK
jgi:hypothetical protein